MITTTTIKHNDKTYKFQRVVDEPNVDNGMYVFPLVDGVYKNGPVYPLAQGDAGMKKLLANGGEVIE